MSRLPALLAGVLLAAAVSTACEATGHSAGCRPAAAAAAFELVPKPKPKKTATREPVCTKANSPVWKGFKPYRGDIKTNGKSGSKQQFYQWDNTHGDIEVYDHNGEHLGSMDPSNGKMIKPPVKGRTLRGLR